MRSHIKKTSLIHREITAKEVCSISLFLIVNFIFSIKYFARYTSYYLPIVFALMCFHIVLFCRRGGRIMQDRYILIANVLLLSCFCIACVFLWSKISAESLNVDRWSVITSFWDYFFSGQYVYYALSHLGNYPGPMPFYFILALPFYFIGELGILSLAGIVLFFLLVKTEKFDSSTCSLVILLLIMTSPFYLWEVLVRSNIFFNSTLILYSLVVFLRIKNYNTLKSCFVMGVIMGLLLSTRNVFALCYIVFFLYSIKARRLTITSAFKVGLIAISTFVATFLPFIVGFWDEFLYMNPFVIQSSFLMPFGWVLAAILISIPISFLCKEDHDLFFYCGLVLFTTILLYAMYHIINSSVYDSLIKESLIDVSYFILCIPFFLYYILVEELDGER